MRLLFGSLALASTMAIAATASAATYHYDTPGMVGSTGDQFSITAIVTDTIVGDVVDGDYARYVSYESNDVAFRINGVLQAPISLRYVQYSEGLVGNVNYGVKVSFNTGPLTSYSYNVDFGGEINPEIIHTYSDLTGGGTFFEDDLTLSIEIHSSSLTPVPGVGALAPLACIATIRRRRRR